MEIATSQLLPRVVRLALIGAATAFAWIVIALLLGLGAGDAHAGDRDDNGLLGGALGAVTSVVDGTASTVAGTVSTVAAGVTETANTVVAAVPAPVQQPVAQVVQTVGTVATTVTTPVAEVVSGGAVGAVTKPAVDMVEQLPVVGDIVTGVGLDDAVEDLSGTVDGTLTEVVGAVDDTGAAIGNPPEGGGVPEIPGLPSTPPIPQLPGGSSTDSPADPVAASADDAATVALSLAAEKAGLTGRTWGAASALSSGAGASAAAVVSSAGLGAGGFSGSGGGLCLPASVSAGPGGAGPGAWALAALLPLAAHRAWVRRAGPEDDHAPPAPPGSTDVSPD